MPRPCSAGRAADRHRASVPAAFHPPNHFSTAARGFLGRDVADDDDGGEIGTQRLGVILLHVVERERGNRLRRGFAQRGIIRRKQRRVQRAAGPIAGALHPAGDELRGLRLDDLERFVGQRGIQFVVGEQLHAARKILLQHIQRETEAGGFVGGDVVERFLKREAVQSLSCRRKTDRRARR